MRSYFFALLSPSWWSVIGLAASLIGVLLLFRYGMPYRTRTDGATFLLLQHRRERAKCREAILDPRLDGSGHRRDRNRMPDDRSLFVQLTRLGIGECEPAPDVNRYRADQGWPPSLSRRQAPCQLAWHGSRSGYRVRRELMVSSDVALAARTSAMHFQAAPLLDSPRHLERTTEASACPGTSRWHGDGGKHLNWIASAMRTGYWARDDRRLALEMANRGRRRPQDGRSQAGHILA
jgi:hypothetical protein